MMRKLAVSLLSLLLSAGVSAAENSSLPEVSHDGLAPQKGNVARVLYTGGGEDVLVLRPTIIDLDATVPDIQSAGRSYPLSESSGAMTLHLDLYDSISGQVLARVVDRGSSRSGSRIQWQNSVTNKVDADRMLRRWASALRERLDEGHGQAGS